MPDPGFRDAACSALTTPIASVHRAIAGKLSTRLSFSTTSFERILRELTPIIAKSRSDATANHDPWDHGTYGGGAQKPTGNGTGRCIRCATSKEHAECCKFSKLKNSNFITMIIGGRRTVLGFEYVHLDTPYYASQGESDVDEPILTCFFTFEYHIEFPCRNVIPYEDDVKAVAEFFDSDILPTCVKWKEVWIAKNMFECNREWVLKKSVFLKTGEISGIENVYQRRERSLYGFLTQSFLSTFLEVSFSTATRYFNNYGNRVDYARAKPDFGQW
jgi:hypothetical protein